MCKKVTDFALSLAAHHLRTFVMPAWYYTVNHTAFLPRVSLVDPRLQRCVGDAVQLQHPLHILDFAQATREGILIRMQQIHSVNRVVFQRERKVKTMQSFFLVLLVLAAIVEVIVANGQYVAPTIWPQVRIICLPLILALL